MNVVSKLESYSTVRSRTGNYIDPYMQDQFLYLQKLTCDFSESQESKRPVLDLLNLSVFPKAVLTS